MSWPDLKKQLASWLFSEWLPDLKHSQRRQSDALEGIERQLKRLADLKENDYLESKNPRS